MPSIKTLPQVLTIISQAEENYAFLPNTIFENLFTLQQKRGKKGNCGAESKTKIKLVRVLTGSFDKSIPLCTFHMYAFIIL